MLLFNDPLTNLSLIRRCQYTECQWRASNIDLCSALMAIERWGFFYVPTLTVTRTLGFYCLNPQDRNSTCHCVLPTEPGNLFTKNLTIVIISQELFNLSFYIYHQVAVTLYDHYKKKEFIVPITHNWHDVSNFLTSHCSFSIVTSSNSVILRT